MIATAPPPMAIKIDGKLYPVEAYADASKMVLAALAEYCGHFRDLPEIGVYEERRKTGHVSTNGKVWLRKDGRDYQVWPLSQPPAGTEIISKGDAR